jgi:hypothetical protein
MAGEVLFGFILSTVGGSAYETVGGTIGLAAVGIVIGSTQWLVLRRQSCRADQWIWVSAAGVVAGVAVSQWLDLVDIYIAPGVELDELLAGAAFGFVVGIAQWMVLRQRVKGAGWWVTVNIIGGAVAFFAGGLIATSVRVTIPGFPTALVTGTLYGMVTGSALIGLLRNPVSDGSNLRRNTLV